MQSEYRINLPILPMSNQEDLETSKFPQSSRFFSRNADLPDLRNFQLLIDENPMAFNGQQTNINYNPFTFPQLKTKANIPLDFFHLPNRIHLTDVPKDASRIPSPNEIPLFKLDEGQAKDPIEFIESVKEAGQTYGAVKLKLPDREDTLIRSNFQVNSDLFWFETNKLLNNPPKDELASRLKFHSELIKFHMSEKASPDEVPTVPLLVPLPVVPKADRRHLINSISNLLNSPSPVLQEEKANVQTSQTDLSNPTIQEPLKQGPIKQETTAEPEDLKKKKSLPPFLLKAPLIDKRTLDLYKLFRSVIIRGGYLEVINKKLWAQIGRELGYKGKIMTSLSSSLKSSYIRILHAFEKHLGLKLFAIVGIVKTEQTELNDNGKRQIGHTIENESKYRKLEAPLLIGSSSEFRRTIRSKTSKGLLLNLPHLIDIKQPNTFTVKAPQQNIPIKVPAAQPFLQVILQELEEDAEAKKKPRKNLDISASSIQPRNQLNHALLSMINNLDSQQDKSSTKSIPKLASIYSMRQFMEKDLKFQEFLIKQNHEKFNKMNAAATYAAIQAPIPYAPIPQTAQVLNMNDSNMPIPERNFTRLDTFEVLYWKFVQNDQVHEPLKDGIEFENGENIPNIINGSGFVKIGDDLINYKNNLNNLSINASNSKFQNSTNKPLHNFSPGTNPSLPNLTSHFHLQTSPRGLQANTASNSSTASQAEATHFNSQEYILNIFEASLLPWNLHNFPVLPNSLLGAFQENDLNNQDLMNSRINIGMTFSTSNWKCEDHFSQLINFQFFGSFKKWYFIPELDFDKFENLVKEVNSKNNTRTSINNQNIDTNVEEILKLLNVDEINDEDTEILLNSLDNMIYPYRDLRLQHSNDKFQELIDLSQKRKFKLNQDFLITPELLQQHGIRYTTTIQMPGEFIVKYPKTYSFSFSMGLNLSEEVNFASQTWLSHALEGEKWLSKQAILPNFLTFKLIVNLIQLYDSGKPVGYSSEVYDNVRSLYEQMYQSEIELRARVRKLRIPEVLIDEKNIHELDLIADDDFSSAFPSRVVLTSVATKQSIVITSEKFLLYVEDDLLDLSQFTAELQLIYSDDKLKQFSKILKNYSIDYEKWILNYETSMVKNPGLSLKVYKSLLSDGERIYSAVSSTNSSLSHPDDEKVDKLNTFRNYIDNLRKFLNNSNKFVEECQSVLAIKYQQRIRNGNEYQSTNGLALLMSLVDKIPTLNFSSVEVDQVIEFKNEIENFDKAARQILSKSSKSLKDFNDLINLGESFGLDIPSLNFLVRIRDRLQWIETFNLIEKGIDPYSDKKQVFTISDLRNFYSQGYNILSSKDLPMIERIDNILKDSVTFDMAISEFLRVEDYFQLDFAKFDDITDKFRLEKLFINVENYNEVSNIHANLHLFEQYKNVVAGERLSYQDAKHLQNSLIESGLKLNLGHLNDELTNVENWLNNLSEVVKAAKVVTTLNKGEKPSDISSKLTIIPELVEKAQAILDKSEFSFSNNDDQYEISSSYLLKFHKDESDEGEEKAPKYYCMCREFEFGTMIECDKCNEWYHVQCVKAESKDGDEDENYSCPLCNIIESESDADKFTADQVTLYKVSEFLKESENLKIYPPNEIEMLRKLVTSHIQISEEYNRQIDEIDASSQSTALKDDILKHISRKLYGSGILIGDLFEKSIHLIRKYENELKVTRIPEAHNNGHSIGATSIYPNDQPLSGEIALQESGATTNEPLPTATSEAIIASDPTNYVTTTVSPLLAVELANSLDATEDLSSVAVESTNVYETLPNVPIPVEKDITTSSASQSVAHPASEASNVTSPIVMESTNVFEVVSKEDAVGDDVAKVVPDEVIKIDESEKSSSNKLTESDKDLETVLSVIKESANVFEAIPNVIAQRGNTLGVVSAGSTDNSETASQSPSVITPDIQLTPAVSEIVCNFIPESANLFEAKQTASENTSSVVTPEAVKQSQLPQVVTIPQPSDDQNLDLVGDGSFQEAQSGAESPSYEREGSLGLSGDLTIPLQDASNQGALSQPTNATDVHKFIKGVISSEQGGEIPATEALTSDTTPKS